MIWKLFKKNKDQASSRNNNDDDSSGSPLQAYFDKIAQLSIPPNADFFVTAAVENSDHFVQVSVTEKPDGSRIYQFDIPVVDWSRNYVDPLKNEALRREAHIKDVVGEPMSFLNIDFTTVEAHEDFVRWVITEVYKLPDTAQFDITWG